MESGAAGATMLCQLRVGEQLHAGPVRDLSPAGFRVETDVGGPLKTVPLGPGPLTIQSVYSNVGGEREPPRLSRIVMTTGNAVGEGPTPLAAWVDAMARSTQETSEHPEWSAAREWLRRLDTARRDGDWGAFGQAYGELLDLFGIAGDSAR